MSESMRRTRRDFLGRAALGGSVLAVSAGGLPAAGATARIGAEGLDVAGLRIVRVEAKALRLQGEFAHGSVRRRRAEAATYFEVETANGLIGHGITAISDPVSVAALTNQALAPKVVGENALENEKIWAKAYWALTPRGQTGLATHAISGVDIALWDLRGKAMGVPVATLIGGARKEVPLYVTFGPAFLSKDELVDVAKAMQQQGFEHLKMVVGQDALSDRDRRPMDQVVAEDIARVAAVREAVGPSAHIYLDGNCNLDLPNAERLVRGLEPYRIAFFEEPITQNDVRLMAELRARTGVTIAAGQNEGMAYRFRDMLVAGAVDYVQPNVMITGGYTQVLKICGMAEAFNVPIANGGAGALQNMHLHAGLAHGGFCEWHLPFMSLCRHIYRDMPEPKAGKVAIPEAPGVGFEPDRAAIAEIALKP